MAYSVISPRFSFVQFNESDYIESYSHGSVLTALPVFEEGDVYFQIILRGLAAEAQAICNNTGLATIGIVRTCADAYLTTFAGGFQTYRLNDTDTLMNWQHGLPDFDDYVSVDECFKIKLTIGGQEFCSNLFKRIGNDNWTTVIEYGNEENAFGFNYCGGLLVGEDPDDGEGGGGATVDCTPLFVEVNNVSTMTIPYTAELQARFGETPSVKVWLNNGNGDLQEMGVQVLLTGGYPPTSIDLDFGGPAIGIIKIY